MVQHHLNPATNLNNYDTTQARLPYSESLSPLDFNVHNDNGSRAELEAAIDITPVNLSPKKISYLLDFLNALTDPSSVDMRSRAPNKVPSGLPIAD